jgi:hypothetical protein
MIFRWFHYGANLFVNRVLASREKARVGVVYALAAHSIKERLNNGEQLRTDDFFLIAMSPIDRIPFGVAMRQQRRDIVRVRRNG